MEQILKKYDDIMQEYCNDVMPHFNSMMEHKSEEFHDLFKKMFDLYLFSSYLVDSKMFPKTLPELDSIKVLYSRASLSYLAVQRCLSFGLVEDACVVLRSLLETRVTLNILLAENTLERLALFRGHLHIVRWEKLNKDRLSLSTGEISSDQYKEIYQGSNTEEIEKYYIKVKDNYHPKKPHHWAWKIFKDEINRKDNPTFKFLCNKMGLEKDYERLYSSLSIFAHSAPISEVTLARDGEIVVAPRFTGPLNAVAYFFEFVFNRCDKSDFKLF
jgi:hypothetical protein